jgi:sugar phosphate isomerase/epimerase
MKLAVFTDEVSQDLDVAVALARRYGCTGVEIRSVWNTPVQKLSSDQVRKIKETLDANGLTCCAISSPVFKCDLDSPEQQKEHLEFLRHCAGVGHALGTNIIRVFAFWRQKGPAKEVWERVREQFRPAVPVAVQEGILLGIENEASTYSGTAAEVRRLIQEMDSPVVRSIWDPCNEIYADEGVTPFPDAYEQVKQWMVHVHVKDAVKKPEPDIRRLGEGDVDWLGQLKALKADGYTEYISMETHWRAAALTEEQMNKPGGQAFSEAGEYATDLCMQNLAALLAKV